MWPGPGWTFTVVSVALLFAPIPSHHGQEDVQRRSPDRGIQPDLHAKGTILKTASHRLATWRLGRQTRCPSFAVLGNPRLVVPTPLGQLALAGCRSMRLNCVGSLPNPGVWQTMLPLTRSVPTDVAICTRGQQSKWPRGSKPSSHATVPITPRQGQSQIPPPIPLPPWCGNFLALPCLACPTVCRQMPWA